MAFRKYKLRFVDTLHFFLEPLSKVSSTYNIDTIKGFFPHMFNSPENQNYIGSMPDEDMYGAKNMNATTYQKNFKPWYDGEKHRGNWDFKEEMIKYCRADVEVLSKAVLTFRKMFKELDIDPFRYVTLASLCMAVFRGCFLPEKCMIANEQNKKTSRVCKEWLLYLADPLLIPEVPILVKPQTGTCTYYTKYQHLFTVDALDKKNKIIKEYNGCYFHGCPLCHPECSEKYLKTMERKGLLEMSGYRVDTIWDCEWAAIKEKQRTTPTNQFWIKTIEEKAKTQHIHTRDALMGGRTEAFKSYLKCNEDEKINYVDYVSLYPTVNALDDYAVGFPKYVDITPKDILNDSFIGLVKCDVKPPKDLYIPVLPDNSDGKLLFHLNDMYEKTWASVELKVAWEKGYEITKIHSAVAYKRFKGLMKNMWVISSK
jgi:hypothetical protein